MAFLRPFVSNIRPHNDLHFMLASNWNKLSTFSFFFFNCRMADLFVTAKYKPYYKQFKSGQNCEKIKCGSLPF